MVDCFHISQYRTRFDEAQNQLLVMVEGSRFYYKILRDAFHQYHFSRTFDDQLGKFDWGTYVHDVADSDVQIFKIFLDRMSKSVFIYDALDQTFALDYHTIPPYEGGGRTSMGNFVYSSKPYNRPVTKKHHDNAKKLSDHLTDFILGNPSYRRADLILSIPALPNKPFDLPTYLVEQICTRLGIENGTQYIRKVRSTNMKDCKTLQEKATRIRGAFSIVQNAKLAAKRVIVVDDIYHSGTTLNEVATILQQAGVTTILGLTATKTITDPS